MSELPKGWMPANLADIARINPRHDQSLEDELAVTFTGMSAISHKGPDFHFSTERQLGDVRTGFTHYAEGDVLFAKITPCMENGKGAVARNLKNGLGFGTTELHVIRPFGGINPYYLYRFMQQASFRKAAEAAFTGSAGQSRVPVEFMRSCQIPLSPLVEQERIVTKLDILLSSVNISQQRLEKIPKLLARFRQSVLAAACSGRLTTLWREEHNAVQSASDLVSSLQTENPELHLEVFENSSRGELPDSWQWAPLGKLGAFVGGGTPSKADPAFWNGKIPWVSAKT
jgi:type I restriction enzyme S subunit